MLEAAAPEATVSPFNFSNLHILRGVALALGLMIAAAGARGQERAAAGDRVGISIEWGETSSTARQRVEPGDRLGVMFHVSIPDPAKPYAVEPGDLLYIQFDYAPEVRQLYFKIEDNEHEVTQLSRPYMVQPDGMLRMVGLREPIAAAGKTVEQIRDALKAAYEGAGILTDASNTVGIESLQNQKHESLLRLFAPAPGRYDNPNPPIPYVTMPVPGDGRLNLPLVGGVPAAGLAVEDISSSVTQRYRALGYDRLDVTFFYDKIGGDKLEQLRAMINAGSSAPMFGVRETGQITLPMLGAQTVAGRTPDEIGKELTRAYRQKRGLEHVEVSVWLETSRLPGR